MVRKSAVRKPAKMSRKMTLMIMLDRKMKTALTVTSTRKTVRMRLLKKVMRRMNLM